MSALSEYVVIIIGVVLAGGYFFRDSLFSEAKPPPTANGHASKQVNTSGSDPRDFVAKLKAGVSTLSLYLLIFIAVPRDIGGATSAETVRFAQPTMASAVVPGYPTCVQCRVTTFCGFTGSYPMHTEVVGRQRDSLARVCVKDRGATE